MMKKLLKLGARVGLPKPKSQVTETLYLLLKKPQSRLSLMNNAYILNSPEMIRVLRDRGVDIETIYVNTVNKYGREVRYGYYALKDEVLAKGQYLKMVTNG